MKRLILALALCVGLAGAAHAQGRSGMSTTDPLGNMNAFRELSAFGACYARSSRSNALAFIATRPGSREEADIFDRYIGGERYSCGSGPSSTQASMVYWRGVIAEGLLRTSGVPESHVLPVPASAEARDLHDAARCYAGRHGADIRGLLATRLGSPEEMAAVGAMWNDFRGCMPAGLSVRLNAPWIRFLLAEAMLRLAPNVTLSGN